jgi:DNA polymerase III delta prime subunit
VTTELVHYFEARGANLEALRSKAPRVLLAGPAGTGKTTVWLEKAHQLCLRTPGVKCLMVRQTLVSLTASGVQTYEQHVAKEAIADGTVTFFGGSLRLPPAFRYSNGSSIALGGMDNVMKVMSTDYDWIYVIEATEVALDGIEKLTTRLRNGRLSFHQLALDCNPDSPTHPLKLECEAGRMVMLHSRHEDNPRFFNRDGSTMTAEGVDYMRTLDALTGVRYLRLRKGIWAAAEGVIFEEFNPAVHLVDRFEVPPSWDRMWSIDFGYVNPFVWQDWAVSPDDQLVLVREIYRTQRLVEDHARDIRAVLGLGPLDRHGRAERYEGPEVTGWDAKRPRIIVCDHDAEDRATFERHMGWPTRPANKNVSDGIQTTQGRFRLDGRGRPRMVFMRDGVVHRDVLLEEAKKPMSTVQEIPGYVWNDKGKDEPMKVDDHGCDGTRYVCMEKDVQPQPRVRFLR